MGVPSHPHPHASSRARQALSGLVERGIQVTLPTMTFSSFLQTLCVSPTLLLLLLQTPPNTVPWGILSAHLHDLLASEAKLTMQAATSLIALFGCGAAAGGLCGGAACQWHLIGPRVPRML